MAETGGAEIDPWACGGEEVGPGCGVGEECAEEVGEELDFCLLRFVGGGRVETLGVKPLGRDKYPAGREGCLL